MNLFQAEWLKIVGNRWVTGLMIWIFPVGTLIFFAVYAVALLTVPSLRADENVARMGLDRVDWADGAISVWTVPNSLVGRLIMLAFTAVVFGGEFQWQTWKSILPHSGRVMLALTKFVAVGLIILLTFTLMSIVVALGLGVLAEIVGSRFGPRMTGAVVSRFLVDYGQQALLAFALTMIAASFAALCGMITRSIIGGALAGIVATYVEGLSVLGLALLADLFDYPRIIELYRFTPSYNVANASSWLKHNHPALDEATAAILGDIFDFSDSLSFSVTMLILWVIALVGLTVYLFQKQDIV